MNIVYGTANFKKNYGLNKINLSIFQINEILKILKNNGIKSLDTAQTYLDHKKKKINFNNFKIYSKLKKIPSKIKKYNELKEYVYQELEKDLIFYNIKNLYGYYIHDTKDLQKHGKKLNLIFQEIKKKKLIKKIGISFYNLEKEIKYLKIFKADLVQVPFNFLLFKQNYIAKLQKVKKNNIKIFARSIYLQGFLLYSWFRIPKKLDIIRSSMKIVENHGYNSKTKKILLTINAIKQSNIFDGMIISCNFKKELRQFLDLYNKKNYFDLSFLDHLRIKFTDIDPRRW